MTLRYLAVVLTLTAIGAGLLGLRQQQLNDKHAIAEWHSQMRDDREAIKGLQVQIAERATPEALQAAIERSGKQFVPIAQSDQVQADAEDAEQDGGESAGADTDTPTVAAAHADHDTDRPQ